MKTRKAFKLSLLSLAVAGTAVYAADTYEIGHTGSSAYYSLNGDLKGSVLGDFDNNADNEKKELVNQSNNTVNVDLGGDTFQGSIYGGDVLGYIQNGNSYTYTSSEKNTVTVNGGKVSNNIYGGYATYAAASNNTVKIEDSSADWVYGGYTTGRHTVGNSTVFGNANNNKVIVNNANSGSFYITGGYSRYGQANNNSVTVTNSKTGKIYGGDGPADTSNNTVTVTNSSTGSIYGADGNGGTIANNKVTVTNSSTGTIYGAYADYSSTLSNNTVTITDSKTSSVIGAYAYDSGSGSKNSVVIKGNSSVGDVYGTTASYGATESSVSIEGNSHASGVYGGSSTGDATGNTVTISSQYAANGSTDAANGKYTIGDDVYGAYSNNSGATGNNTVTFTGGQTVAGSIYGGNTTLTGNTLTWV